MQWARFAVIKSMQNSENLHKFIAFCKLKVFNKCYITFRFCQYFASFLQFIYYLFFYYQPLNIIVFAAFSFYKPLSYFVFLASPLIHLAFRKYCGIFSSFPICLFQLYAFFFFEEGCGFVRWSVIATQDFFLFFNYKNKIIIL